MPGHSRKKKTAFPLSTDISKKDKSVVSGKTIEEFEDIKKTPGKVISIETSESAQVTEDVLKQAGQAEADRDLKTAEKLYKLHLKKFPREKLAYTLLMIIYRKQKMYKEELNLLDKAIKVFEDYINRRRQKKMSNKNAIKTLGNSLMKNLGLADKKGNLLYEPEPLPTWKKRRQIVVKKLS